MDHQNSLENYSNHSVKFLKQEIEYPTGDFSVSIPKEWVWKVETYEHKNYILGIDAGSKPDGDGLVDIISVQKIKSLGNNIDLTSEFSHYLELLDENWEGNVVGFGKTDILSEEAYYVHTKNYPSGETISFILESEVQGVFYNLTASSSNPSDEKNNMAIMIDCLKTFERNSN